MKKLFSLIICLCVAHTLLPASALTVANGYRFVGAALIIESDAAFDSILYEWRDMKDDIESVTVYEGVTSLPYGCFSNLTELSEVSLPSSLSEIGHNAFEGCTSLRAVSIPVGVSEICSRAFANCSVLTDVFLPEGLNFIGSHAFFACRALEEITIPASVKKIEDHAFSFCDSLAHVAVVGDKTEFCENSFVHYSNTETVIFCTKNSRADKLAQEWHLPFDYGDIIYSVSGKVKMVEKHETEVYLLSGWRLTPYEKKKKLSADEKTEAEPPTASSAPRIFDIYNAEGEVLRVSEVGAKERLSRGWYMVPVCRIYAPGGISAVVARTEADAYFAVGWYPAPVVTMYSADGRTIIVYEAEEYAYSLVGWHK